MMGENEIINKLISNFGNEILPIIPFPKPYYKDITNIKAIYLGCDPSNKHSTSLEFAFGLKSNLNIFNKFHRDQLSNLEEVNLNWDNVYVQNLCRNYFLKETSENLKLWKRAAKCWIPNLKDELKFINQKIPILLTSSYLYDVLIIGKWRKYKPIDFYTCKKDVPVPEEFNILQRPLIPFYRNRRKIDYHLSNQEWKDYKEKIKLLIKENSGKL